MTDADARACMGAPTKPRGDMRTCLACGVEVHHAFVDDPEFGFKSLGSPCPHAEKKTP